MCAETLLGVDRSTEDGAFCGVERLNDDVRRGIPLYQPHSVKILSNKDAPSGWSLLIHLLNSIRRTVDFEGESTLVLFVLMSLLRDNLRVRIYIME